MNMAEIRSKGHSEYDGFPLVDTFYTDLYAYNGFISVLDEIDNSDLIGYCEHNVLNLIQIEKGKDNGVLLLCFENRREYVKIKEKFPDIKEICVLSMLDMDFIYKDEIKTYFERIDSNSALTAFVEGSISSEILRLFTYSYRPSFIYGYNILIPDFDTYKMLVLLLGGTERLELYTITRNHVL